MLLCAPNILQQTNIRGHQYHTRWATDTGHCNIKHGEMRKVVPNVPGMRTVGKLCQVVRMGRKVLLRVVHIHPEIWTHHFVLLHTRTTRKEQHETKRACIPVVHLPNTSTGLRYSWEVTTYWHVPIHRVWTCVGRARH